VRRRIISSLIAACWAFLTFIGFELLSSVGNRGAAGFPDAGQWQLYVLFPSAMLLLSVGMVFLSKRLTTGLYVTCVVVGILPIAPFLLIYGGGI
jgi:hypothetical protein